MPSPLLLPVAMRVESGENSKDCTALLCSIRNSGLTGSPERTACRSQIAVVKKSGPSVARYLLSGLMSMRLAEGSTAIGV